MQGLYINDNLITPYTVATEDIEAIKVENRLLDGSYHVQTIGVPATILVVRLHVSRENKHYIDQAAGLGQPVKIVENGVSWLGYIRQSNLSWKRISKMYKTEFTLLVTEKGVA